MMLDIKNLKSGGFYSVVRCVLLEFPVDLKPLGAEK